jgi:hypothetical protein
MAGMPEIEVWKARETKKELPRDWNSLIFLLKPGCGQVLSDKAAERSVIHFYVKSRTCI